jgi:tripartite-type tricarboxylate transporter receptor subunit TctC
VDAAARIIAEQMKTHSPAVVVENRPGAGGRLALTALKYSPADGTILVLTPGDQLTLFPHIYNQLDYRPADDFAPITTICTTEFLLNVGPLVPDTIKTLPDFMAWCKENPKLASYGSPGAGTRPHFVGVALKEAAGINMVHAPYKGGAAAIQDMLGGHLASYIGTIGNTLSLVQAGSIRALATSSPVRNAAIPEVPTFREAGYPGAEAIEWFGLFAPAHTPATTLKDIQDAVHRALENPQAKSGLESLPVKIQKSSPEELEALIRSDTRRSAQIVQISGFKATD